MAIVLLSLSDKNALGFFSLMIKDEITEVFNAMSYLGAVSHEIIEIVMNRLTSDLAGDTKFLGNWYTIEKLLQITE